jgi:hypothetical protein
MSANPKSSLPTQVTAVMAENFKEAATRPLLGNRSFLPPPKIGDYEEATTELFAW